MKSNRKKRSAFSLIELSIVLIIIGLLIAGVTGGASLIKSSELRSVITEARNWAIAVNSFYNQFDALPGDYGTVLGGSGAGNGNENIEYFNSDSVSEGRNAWVQMRSAAILDAAVLAGADAVIGVDTGIGGAGSPFGEDTPASRIRSAGWDFDFNTTTTQNVVVLTGATTGDDTQDLVNSATSNATGVITPTDALSLDSKFDDGNPAGGKIRGVLGGCDNDIIYTTTDPDNECAVSYQVDINS